MKFHVELEDRDRNAVRGFFDSIDFGAILAKIFANVDFGSIIATILSALLGSIGQRQKLEQEGKSVAKE